MAAPGGWKGLGKAILGARGDRWRPCRGRGGEADGEQHVPGAAGTPRSPASLGPARARRWAGRVQTRALGPAPSPPIGPAARGGEGGVAARGEGGGEARPPSCASPEPGERPAAWRRPTPALLPPPPQPPPQPGPLVPARGRRRTGEGKSSVRTGGPPRARRRPLLPLLLASLPAGLWRCAGGG